MVTDARIASQLDELASWCLGADARSAAASELRRLGLPSDDDHIDDVCQDVLLSVLRRIERTGPIHDARGDSAVVAYARRTLGHAVVDLVRLGSQYRLAELMDPETLGTEFVSDEADYGLTPLGAEPDAAYLQLLRQRVHVLMAESPRVTPNWAAAAAFVTVTLADRPDLPLQPGTPQPDQRSSGASAATRWAGLAYAGRHDCFADPETGAVRERRSTALRRVDAVLRSAVQSARQTDVDGTRR